LVDLFSVALDWVGDFKENPTLPFLKKTLESAPAGKYVESDIGEKVIAAAEVVAASLGRHSQDFPNELMAVITRSKKQFEALAPLARAAVLRVNGATSELRENWSLHAEDLDEWEKSVNGLVSRLSPRSA
jgi:hypothetical protein